ncbi:MAG: zinc ribbon domain-containing protein [Clostridia bacterium]|nr:zinc ribbon domain-containing protein [Clostridia bacterium]
MKCKECGAKFPDNKKFCIDCGAWVNPPEERQCIHNNYYEPERYRYTPAVIKKFEQRDSNPISYKQASATINSPSPIIKKGIIGLVIVAAIVFILFLAVTLILNTVDEFAYGDSFYPDTDSYIDRILENEIQSVDYNDGYADEQEKLALEYVESYINGMDYATFDKLTALDTEKVYTDIMNGYMDKNILASEEQYFNELTDSYGEPVSDIYGSIDANLAAFSNEKSTYFADMYGDDYSYGVTYSCEIDSESLYGYYYSYVDSNLDYSNKKLSDYLPDYENLTDIYDICVDFAFDDGYSTYYESTWIVVADAGNGPEIVYDDTLIDGIFSTLSEY